VPGWGPCGRGAPGGVEAAVGAGVRGDGAFGSSVGFAAGVAEGMPVDGGLSGAVGEGVSLVPGDGAAPDASVVSQSDSGPAASSLAADASAGSGLAASGLAASGLAASGSGSGLAAEGASSSGDASLAGPLPSEAAWDPVGSVTAGAAPLPAHPERRWG
jgi:hypothetical protein